MWRKPETVLERVDVNAALEALWDIRRELARIRQLLEEDDGEARQEDEDDA